VVNSYSHRRGATRCYSESLQAQDHVHLNLDPRTGHAVSTQRVARGDVWLNSDCDKSRVVRREVRHELNQRKDPRGRLHVGSRGEPSIAGCICRIKLHILIVVPDRARQGMPIYNLYLLIRSVRVHVIKQRKTQQSGSLRPLFFGLVCRRLTEMSESRNQTCLKFVVQFVMVRGGSHSLDRTLGEC